MKKRRLIHGLIAGFASIMSLALALPVSAVEDLSSSPFISRASFHIDPSDYSGAFSYSYPFTLPPGRGNSTPSLSLEYSSAASDTASIAGYGWALTIPVIERVNKRGVDNLYTRHDFTSTFSGELEDIALSDSTHGTFGAKVETGAFLTYEYGMDETWTVKDNKGTTYTFGATSAARTEDPLNTARVSAWHLSQIRDANGDTVNYTYTKSGNRPYLSSINYSGNAELAGAFDILFTYAARPDTQTSFATGFDVTTSDRLAQVRILSQGQEVRRYDFSYVTGDNGIRSLLASITETATSEIGESITKPSTTFSYSASERTWTEEPSFTFPIPIGGTSAGSMGVYLFDVNADTLPDVVKSKNGQSRQVFINQGNNQWELDTNYVVPIDFSLSNGRDMGVRVFDVNGDGFQDLIYSRYFSTGVNDQAIYVNNADGTGWTEVIGATIPLPLGFVSDGGIDMGVRVMDVNGDGMQDLVKARGIDESADWRVYLHNGDNIGWTEAPSYSVPIAFTTGANFDMGVRPMDVNGDGLVDLAYSRYLTSGLDRTVYLNKGDGSGWVEDASFIVPIGFINAALRDVGGRFLDMNGDGLTDILRSQIDEYGNHYMSLHTNNGGTGWTQDTTFSIPQPLSGPGGLDLGVREADVNGDMLDDIIYSRQSYDGTWEDRLFLADGESADILTEVHTPQGAIKTVDYTSSVGANPDLWFPMRIVESVVTNDGIGGISAMSYAYESGSYHFADSYDRKFAGFGKVKKTDGFGDYSIEYFHQGNETESGIGEVSDDISKVGKLFREEIYNAAGELMSVAIHAWENTGIGNERDFVMEKRVTERRFDGDADHIDSSATFTFDTTNGNLLEEKRFGEVIASNDGTFTDTGDDIMTTTSTYASWVGGGVSGYKQNESTFNQAGTKMRETKWKYDNHPQGSVAVGNPTAESKWISGSETADSQFSYDAFGFMTSTTDPRGNTTTFTPDAHHLYPISEINPLGQTTSYSYDYSSGQVQTKTDANGFTFETVFDAFDRPLTVKQPDPNAPSTLITAKSYSYNDASFPTSLLEQTWKTSSIAEDAYTYFDGFGRLIQRRVEVGEGNTYNVSDTIYDARGDIWRVSLPYAGIGSARSTATTDENLYTTSIYDSLRRVTQVTNAIGTVTKAYDQGWTTETDANGKVKKYRHDAHGRLTEVEEVSGGEVFTTRYDWDANNNLVTLTDSAGNIRRFTYDGLGRRVSAEDLHRPSDGSFGTWGYAYDSAGNLITHTQPYTSTITYAYDALNRLVSEDVLNTTEIDLSYTYDACKNGIGRLCSASVLNGASTSHTYDPLGRTASETRTIYGNPFTTSYAYDVQGGVAGVIYPDLSETTYAYNDAGQITAVYFDDIHGAAVETVVSDISYGPHGKATSVVYGNGVVSTWNYDPSKLYRLGSATTLSGAGMIEDFTYTFDGVGNLTNLADRSSLYANMDIAYDYDDLHRLTSAQSTSTDQALSFAKSWTYDRIGNITWSSDEGGYSYNGATAGNPHAATSIGGATLVYKHNGTLTTDGTWTNTWNYKSELTATRNGTVVNYYRYDHKGDRVSTARPGEGTLYYPNQYYTREGPSKMMRHIFAGDLGSVATSTWDGAANSTAYHHKDHLGGTHVETDATGAVLEYIVYSPFGGTIKDEKTGNYENLHKFTGKEKDKNTGWYYYGARHYNPSHAHFISLDPVFKELGSDKNMLNRVLRDPQTQNAYAYARNNPIKFIDPDGEYIESALDIGFMAFDLLSLKQNIQSGKVGGAMVDSVSLIADTGGLGLPGITGLGLGVRGVVKGTTDGVNALTDAVNSIEVLSRQTAKGTSRSTHRANANKALFNELLSNPGRNAQMSDSLGVDVISHMSSGKAGLKNPPGTQWHHPADNANELQLLRTDVHRGSQYQEVLHPDRSGGFSKFFKK